MYTCFDVNNVGNNVDVIGVRLLIPVIIGPNEENIVAGLLKVSCVFILQNSFSLTFFNVVNIHIVQKNKSHAKTQNFCLNTFTKYSEKDLEK